MMSIKDYAVLVALYMIVSLQGRNLLKGLKLNKFVKANSAQDALVHGLVFIGLLYLVGMLSRKVAGYGAREARTKKRYQTQKNDKSWKSVGKGATDTGVQVGESVEDYKFNKKWGKHLSKGATYKSKCDDCGCN